MMKRKMPVKLETASEEEDGRDPEDQHAQHRSVQLPEAYQPRNDRGLKGAAPEIDLSRTNIIHTTLYYL